MHTGREMHNSSEMVADDRELQHAAIPREKSQLVWQYRRNCDEGGTARLRDANMNSLQRDAHVVKHGQHVFVLNHSHMKTAITDDGRLFIRPEEGDNQEEALWAHNRMSEITADVWVCPPDCKSPVDYCWPMWRRTIHQETHRG